MILDGFLRALVSRGLPQPTPDGSPQTQIIRGMRYNELATIGLMRKQHALADEGSFFVANGGDTAITGQTTQALDATKPSLLIQNTAPQSGGMGKRIYIDYISLLGGGTAYSNLTSNTGMYFYLGIDTILRYSSAGTALTVANVNGDVPNASSVAQVWAGAIVTLTAGSAFRTIGGRRLMRLPVSSTVLSTANADRWYFNFGGVETGAFETSTDTTSATLESKWVSRYINCPPIIIGPQQSFLFNINCITGGTVTAGNLFYEIGWSER